MAKLLKLVMKESEELVESRNHIDETISKFVYDFTRSDFDKYKETAWSARVLINARGNKIYEVNKNGPSDFTVEDIKNAILSQYPKLELIRTINTNNLYFMLKQGEQKESVVLRQAAEETMNEEENTEKDVTDKIADDILSNSSLDVLSTNLDVKETPEGLSIGINPDVGEDVLTDIVNKYFKDYKVIAVGSDKDFKIYKFGKEESIDEAADTLDAFIEEHNDEIMDAYNNEMAALENITPEEYAAQDNAVDEEVFNAVAESMWEDSKVMTEDAHILINDGRKEEPDYLIQDVTELEDLSDEDVESPSIDGLLSLVNESLDTKYGNSWGYLKAKSIAKKENLQYAIIDIVTPSILKEAKEAKIKDNAVSKTVILENVPNSKKLVNLKINTLAGTTRFSQKTANPAKVLTRWLESEYLYEEMVDDFQKKIDARQAELKGSLESYLKQHPDLQLRIDTLKAQAKILKDAGSLEDALPTVNASAYAIASEFPANVIVKSDKKNNATQEFDDIGKIVVALFGRDWLKEESKEEANLAKANKKAVKDALKEQYETFNIGEIEGTFNPVSMEAMYSIPSKNIKDKKINLTKVPSTNTPYDTDTIIRNYIETTYGPVGEESTPLDADVPIVTNADQSDANDPKEDEAPSTSDDKEDLQEDVQSETGTASFYKVRQKDPVSIEDILNRSAQGANAQESEYIVVKEVNLDKESMDALLSDLSKPQSFCQGVEPVDRKNYAFNVVKVSSDSSPYTLLVDSVGYDYPRYVGILQK